MANDRFSDEELEEEQEETEADVKEEPVEEIDGGEEEGASTETESNDGEDETEDVGKRTNAPVEPRRDTEWAQALFKLLAATPDFFKTRDKTVAREKIAADLRKQGFLRDSEDVRKRLVGWITRKRTPRWMSEEDKAKLKAMRETADGTTGHSKGFPWHYHLFKEVVSVEYFSLKTVDKIRAREQIVASLKKKKIERTEEQVYNGIYDIFGRRGVPDWLTVKKDKEVFRKIKEMKKPLFRPRCKVTAWRYSLFKQLVTMNYFDLHDKIRARKEIIIALKKEQYTKRDDQIVTGIYDLFRCIPKWLTDQVDVENYEKLKHAREKALRRARGSGGAKAPALVPTKRRRIQESSDDDREEEGSRGDRAAPEVQDQDEEAAEQEEGNLQNDATPLQMQEDEEEDLEGGAMDSDRSMMFDGEYGYRAASEDRDNLTIDDDFVDFGLWDPNDDQDDVTFGEHNPALLPELDVGGPEPGRMDVANDEELQMLDFAHNESRREVDEEKLAREEQLQKMQGRNDRIQKKVEELEKQKDEVEAKTTAVLEAKIVVLENDLATYRQKLKEAEMAKESEDGEVNPQFTPIDSDEIRDPRLRVLLELEGHVIGDKKKRYKIHEPVGHGTFGVVLRSIHVETGKARALKLVVEEAVAKKEKIMVVTMRQISPGEMNEYICCPTDFFTWEYKGVKFIALPMDLLKIDLYSLCFSEEHRSKKFPPPTVLSIEAQLFSALQFLNLKNIIHADVKQENLMMKTFELKRIGDEEHIVNPVVRLIDLNCIREFGDIGLCQTARLRAPEVVLGLEYDERIDSWSGGVLALELLQKAFFIDVEYNEDDAEEKLFTHLALIQAAIQRDIPEAMWDKSFFDKNELPELTENQTTVFDILRRQELYSSTLILRQLLITLLNPDHEERPTPATIFGFLQDRLPQL